LAPSYTLGGAFIGLLGGGGGGGGGAPPDVAKQLRRHRNSAATEFARIQRATANEFACLLWQLLRNRECCGKKFRREVVIDPFTVDFCCVDLKLIVEVDGKDHFTDEGMAADRRRDQYLTELGYAVLRFPGYEVLSDSRLVYDQIAKTIAEIRGC